MTLSQQFLTQHLRLTRRRFIKLGVTGTAIVGGSVFGQAPDLSSPEVVKALEKIEPFFTPPKDFRDVSRGKPLPHSLPEEKKRAVGLLRETWKLEVMADPERPPVLGRQLTSASGSALRLQELSP